MLKYILCAIMAVLLVVDVLILLDTNKYIKLHKDELIEIHKNKLLGRLISMTLLSVCVQVIGVVIYII